MNEKETNGYHISLFKPTTERARFNRNLIVWLASIWFVAIFGFQIALRVFQKPTPEPSFIAFENVWENVSDGTASEAEYQQFAFSALSVLGKVAIGADERLVLDNAVSHSLFMIYPDSMKEFLTEEIATFEKLKSEITDIGDETYLAEKIRLKKLFSPKLGLDKSDIRTDVLPLELSAVNINLLTDETVNKLPSIMGKYLVHNQSFLTDAKFLGFPFHYFYTAVFLLILFVGLCLVYCLRIDRRNAILGIKE